MKKLNSTFVLVLGLLSVVNVAKAAALIDLSLGTSINYDSNTSVSNTSVNTDDNTSLRASANANASSKSSVDTKQNSQVKNEVKVVTHEASDPLTADDDIWVENSTHGSKGGTEASSEASDQALLNANGNSALNFKASNVVSVDDLRAFASSTVENDLHINELRFRGDKVDVGYKDNGKFLGLFKIPYKVHVITKPDGTVSVKYPWYAFLFSPDRQTVGREISQAVSNIVGNTASTTGSTTLSASVSAQIVEAIRNILIAHFGTGLGVTGSSTNATSSRATTTKATTTPQ
jgi:hypothetical protein